MKSIIEKVAQLNGVSVEECRREMEAALDAAGIELDLETFIALCAARAMQLSDQQQP